VRWRPRRRRAGRARVQVGAERRVLREAPQRARERVEIAGVEQETAITDRFGQGAPIAGGHRHAARLCLRDRNRKALVERGADVAAAAAEQRRQIGRGHPTGQANALTLQSERLGAIAQRAGAVALGSRQHEAPGFVEPRVRERLEQTHLILPASEGTQVEQIRSSAKFVRREHRVPLRGFQRPKAIEVDSCRHHADPRAGDPQVIHQRGRALLAVCDHEVRTRDRLANARGTLAPPRRRRELRGSTAADDPRADESAGRRRGPPPVAAWTSGWVAPPACMRARARHVRTPRRVRVRSCRFHPARASRTR
jgi:hypothetical protein